MVLPNRFSTTTPHWYDQTLPSDPDQMAAFIASHNGTTPMFQPSHAIPGPNGEAGWTMAGNDNPNLNNLTPGEYYAQLLNNRATQAGLHPNSPDAKMFELAMLSRSQVRPEEMQAAYNAAGSGTGGPHPILNDAMLNFLESLGYGPPKSTGTSGSGKTRPLTPGDRTNGGPGDGRPRDYGSPPPGYHYEGDILVKDGPTRVTSDIGGGVNPLPPNLGSTDPYTSPVTIYPEIPPDKIGLHGLPPNIEPWLMNGGGGVPPPGGGPNLDPSLFPPGMLENWLNKANLPVALNKIKYLMGALPPTTPEDPSTFRPQPQPWLGGY